MDMNFYKKYIKVGLNISYYRKLSGYTQLELAEKLDISNTHMGNIELARAGVSLDVLFKISETLNVPANKFLEDRD